VLSLRLLSHKYVLTTNSALFFADSLLEKKTRPSAYTLFDLSTVIESIVLYDKLYTLPSYRLQKTDLAKRLTSAGILEEVPVGDDVARILDSARNMSYSSENELGELAAMVSTALPVNRTKARHALEVASGYASSQWRTPTGYNTARDWFYDSLNDEVFDIRSWEIGQSKPDLEELESDPRVYVSEGGRSALDNMIAEIVVRGEMYIMVAGAFGVDYHPDVIRIPLTVYRLKQTAVITSAIAQVIHILEQNRVSVAEEAKKFYDIQEFEFELPVILSVLLPESRSPFDLVTRAIEYRKSRYARSFRDWMAKIDLAKTREGFDRQLLVDSARNLKSSIDPGSPTIKARLNCVPSLGINYQSLGVDLTSVATWGINELASHFRRPYKVFLPQLRGKLEGLKSNSKNLEQVFGSRLDEDQERLFSEISSGVELLYSTPDVGS